MAITIIGSLVAAFLNAVGALTQRRATGQLDVKRLFHHGILAEALRNKAWLLGGLAQVAAFGAQGLALSFGSLIVVGPLMTTDLVFLMLLLRAYLRVDIGRREWLAAAAVSGGLSVLLIAANPRSGDIPYDAVPWLLTGVVFVPLIVIGAIFIRRLSLPRWRAGVAGVVAGAHFAFTDALLKLVMDQLHYGVLQEFTNWPLYALSIVAITSLLSLQSMYGAGPLGISWPLVEITEAVASILVGLTLFGDVINASPVALAGQLVGGMLLVAGIVMLGGSKRLRGAQT